jgi:hypothetical protein
MNCNKVIRHAACVKITRMSVKTTFTMPKLDARVLKSFAACKNSTLRVKITLVLVVVTLVHVKITLMYVENTLVGVYACDNHTLHVQITP